MIFKRIGNGRPYPDHGRESTRQWADVAPRPVRLDQLVTTKQQLGSPAAADVAGRLEASLDASLKAMRLERVDLYFLHSNIHADGFHYAHGNAHRDTFSTSWSLERTRSADPLPTTFPLDIRTTCGLHSATNSTS